MNILLISQCTKNALTETRRILDQFAERRGDRSWQTAITQQGLDTLYRLLRKTARKNTAVACHWIRGKDHSELLWVVGDARQFNALGAVPTNTTKRNILRREGEDDWHALQGIHLLTSLAAMLHDLGKACRAFQERLLPWAPFTRNVYRHEWISLRLFQAFVGASTDEEWLQRLIAPTPSDDACWLAEGRLLRDGLDAAARTSKPFAILPPLARAVAWLVLTHHRLPVMPAEDEKGRRLWLGARVRDFRSEQLANLLKRVDADWNELSDTPDRAAINPYWQFPHGLPVTLPAWRKRAARIARRLLEQRHATPVREWCDDPFVMHLSRLSLMLADHHYSSLTDKSEREQGETGYPLFANTRRDTGALNQTLDEHLLGVTKHAGVINHALPGFEHHLPRLARHKGLRKRSLDARFHWQDRATDTAAAMRERAARHGAFIVNMASTGCGKTLANARIMNALADPLKGMRCAFALGLRTLTLQTGHAFRDLLGLSDAELAIKVGGAASRELFEFHERQAEQSGSASSQSLLPEDGHVLFEGNAEHPLLQRLSRDPQVRSLLAAPLLVCTVDHLTPATESQRGGRQIAPMLRLLTGDLVLDEPDDFDVDDLPALTRLVHWAGLLGSRVLLSSATLPPALVEGLFLAYLDGRAWYQRNRGERPGEAPSVCCAWFDEFDQVQQDCADSSGFLDAHQSFVLKRHACLAKEPVRRLGELIPLPAGGPATADIRAGFAHAVREAALGLHGHHHSMDTKTGKRVSFGLVRMANIEPLFDVALALYAQGMPPGYRLHLCVYHSQYPLLIRSAIETRLDATLNRRKPEAVFDLADIRERLDRSPEPDQLFIVLGSPVTEVGRDHDYDWAIVEPSSVRSLIQLAGRIRRHRPGAVETANLRVFDTNLRHLENPGKAAFCRPGFEQDDAPFRLRTHRLADLLDAEEVRVIDARPRILPRPEEQLQPTLRLVDLEHARMRRQMLPQATSSAPLTARQLRSGHKPKTTLNAASHWNAPQVWLTAFLPQQQRFRDDPTATVDVALLPTEDEDDYALHRIDPGKRKWEAIYVQIENSQNHRVADSQVRGEGVEPWGEADYLEALNTLAESLEMSLLACAQRFGTVSLPDSEQGWRFHPALGFTKERR